MKKVVLALIMAFILVLCAGCNSLRHGKNDCCNTETKKQDCCKDKEDTSGNGGEDLNDVPDCCKAE
ncbi:MAG: hypothetical protein J5590_00115 [Clostridia bacterium]|nr:hypothetical protein [Clostridia bacterium]